jgi:23S rRNA (cytosine1962-C5)-methyltransferase
VTATIQLQPGREKSVLRRHPWVLSGAVRDVSTDAASGALVRVASSSGATLGFGHYSPASQIRVRMLSFGEPPPPEDVIERRIAAAISRRISDPLLRGTNAVRLVNAEGDDLPGLIADRFDRALVVKLQTDGMIAARERIASALRAACPDVQWALERSDESSGKHEGAGARESVLFGAPPEDASVWIEEHGRRYLADLRGGQKTGFYLDQRDARDLCEALGAGRRMLDLFSHSGGFAVAAQRGGAESVTAVESSKDALALAEKNLGANQPACASRLVNADVHKFLRQERGEFDLIVVDPPPLAKHKRDIDRAARAYKDALLYALLRASSTAIVFGFSCSHHVGSDLFKKIVFGASLDARRSLQVLRELGQPVDHPISIDHPEGRYLSGLLMRVLPR